MKTKPVIIRSLAAFEQMQRHNTIKPQQTLVFDLHLESGRKALEVIEQLPGGTDYLFMTSDYLNSALLDAAEKGQFLVVPKDLMGNALEHARKLTSQTMEPSSAITCLETSASIKRSMSFGDYFLITLKKSRLKQYITSSREGPTVST